MLVIIPFTFFFATLYNRNLIDRFQIHYLLYFGFFVTKWISNVSGNVRIASADSQNPTEY